MERVFNKIPYTSVGEAMKVVQKEFPGNYRMPWWGTKMTSGIRGHGTIHNLGFVIGFRDDAKRQRFRLDYDPNPTKALHINYECDHPRDKVCFLIKPYVIQGGDEMWNFYCTWTTQHAAQVPANVKAKLGAGKVWRGKHWA